MKERGLDRAYLRERDERADARADREARLAMIIAALGNISKGFAAY